MSEYRSKHKKRAEFKLVFYKKYLVPQIRTIRGKVLAHHAKTQLRISLLSQQQSRMFHQLDHPLEEASGRPAIYQAVIES